MSAEPGKKKVWSKPLFGAAIAAFGVSVAAGTAVALAQAPVNRNAPDPAGAAEFPLEQIVDRYDRIPGISGAVFALAPENGAPAGSSSAAQSPTALHNLAGHSAPAGNGRPENVAAAGGRNDTAIVATTIRIRAPTA